MGLSFPILKTWLVWLTTVVSLVGSFPQFNCICPDGSKHTRPLFAISTKLNCCCGISAASPVGRRLSPPAAGCPRCHAQNELAGGADAGNAGSHCTGKQCLKSITAPDLAATGDPTDTTRLEFQFVSLPLEIGFQSVVSGSPSQTRSYRDERRVPPPDLVITLRHLVI